MHNKTLKTHYFDALVNTIAQLRDPETGCPWDLKQDHHSLSTYLIEESYELLQTLLNKDFKNMKEELGDVLLQILLHSRIASETHHFDIEEVCKSLNEKMIRRHPHVFSDKDNNISIPELHERWEEIKSKEGKKQSEFIKEKDLHLPALKSAHKIGARTQKVNFDWSNPEEAIEQLEKELKELKEAILNPETNSPYNFENSIEEELGDLLFSVAQVSRHLNFDPEITLSKANNKFYTRFQEMLKISDKDFMNLTSEEKELLWQKVKRNEKSTL